MSRPTILLVTGSGRSGTSTVAGTLKRLGWHIPPPEVETDWKNPRGYYEPLWVTEFHKHLLEPLPVRTIDTRPDANVIATEAVGAPEERARLRGWLAENLDQPQVLIKDPRAYWVLPVWTDLAAEAGADLATLTMLRHPTAVARSRDSAYLHDKSDDFRHTRETANVAAWVNAALVTEHDTRGLRRVFVRYEDLLADWRTAMDRAATQLGVTWANPPVAGEHHDVDDFIDVKLNRSANTWDDIDVPDDLRTIAEETWTAMNALVDDPGDQSAIERLGDLQRRYARFFGYSKAVAMDYAAARAKDKAREIRGNKKREIANLRQRLRALEEENEQLRSGGRSLLARVARRLRARQRSQGAATGK